MNHTYITTQTDHYAFMNDFEIHFSMLESSATVIDYLEPNDAMTKPFGSVHSITLNALGSQQSHPSQPPQLMWEQFLSFLFRFASTLQNLDLFVSQCSQGGRLSFARLYFPLLRKLNLTNTQYDDEYRDHTMIGLGAIIAAAPGIDTLQWSLDGTRCALALLKEHDHRFKHFEINLNALQLSPELIEEIMEREVLDKLRHFEISKVDGWHFDPAVFRCYMPFLHSFKMEAAWSKNLPVEHLSMSLDNTARWPALRIVILCSIND